MCARCCALDRRAAERQEQLISRIESVEGAIKAFHKLTYRKRVLEENKKKYSKSFHHDAWDVPDTSDAHKASLRGLEKVSLQESFDAVERSIQAVQADMKVDIKSVEDNLTKLIQPRTAEKEKAGNIWVVHEPTIKVICGSRYDATDRGAVSSRLVSRGRHLPVETGGLQAFLMEKNVPGGKGFVIKLPRNPQDYQGSQLCNHMADAVYNKLVQLQALV